MKRGPLFDSAMFWGPLALVVVMIYLSCIVTVATR